jgi:selenocysteine-specific translation elongation factor
MNLIIAIPFDESLGEFIGKKGSENSITFYNRKYNSDLIVGIMPSSIAEKFYALPQCLLVADAVLVSTKSIDKDLGEVLVACMLLKKPTILTKDNDVSTLLSAMQPKNFSFSSQEELLDRIISIKSADPSTEKRVDIDRAFNVKGIGTVALGVVTKGTVKVHDTLYHNSGKLVSIRSIQSQDEDIKEAASGTRVGLALKNIEDSGIEKGDILANVQAKSGRRLKLEVSKSPFVKEEIEIGKCYSIATGFSFSNATVESVEGNRIILKLEKQISAEIGDNSFIMRTIIPRIFASGRILEISP